MLAGHHQSATLHTTSADHHTSPAVHLETVRVTVPGHVTVQAGDTLSQLAKRYYGHADRWPALWWTNRHKIANPNSIAVGQVLTLTRWHPDDPALLRRALSRVPRPEPAHLVSTSRPSSPAGAAAPAPTASAGTVQASSGYQACVIRAESGGNPLAINPSSGASGLYGFLDSTWQSVTGLPGAARDYSEATQTAAFWKLYGQAGRSPWITDGC